MSSKLSNKSRKIINKIIKYGFGYSGSVKSIKRSLRTTDSVKRVGRRQLAVLIKNNEASSWSKVIK